MDFQAFFDSSRMLLWLVMDASFFGIIPPYISHFEHDHFILAQTIEKFEDWSTSYG